MREDSARLKAGLKPHLAHLNQPIADAFNAVADYVVEFARWMRKTHRWDADKTSLECWHVQHFPVLVEQLKYVDLRAHTDALLGDTWRLRSLLHRSVLVQRHLSKLGQAPPNWSLAAQSLVIKMQHADQARMQKLAAQGRWSVLSAALRAEWRPRSLSTPVFSADATRCGD
jgi:hypothetical protein